MVSDDAKYFLAIVLPAFNESRRIRSSLGRLDEFLRSRPYSAQVIVVDDGSVDDTNPVAAAFVAAHPGFSLITNIVNQGKGASVKTGMMAARAAYVLFMDMDLPVTLDMIDVSLAAINAAPGFDIVTGTRYYSGAPMFLPVHRYAMGRFFNMLVRMFLFKDITDTQCGFKLFTHSAAQSIFSRLTMPRFGFDLEIFYLARFVFRYDIFQQVVAHQGSTDSTVSVLKDSREILLSALKIRREIKKGTNAF
jgi:glycosyltransferase involved in cell wall biosynthesis